MKQPSKSNHLFVALPIIQTYGITGAWVFSHIAFFAAKYAIFDTEIMWPSSVKKRTGVGKNTYKNYLKRFVSDGLLIKTGNKHTFNEANLVFNDVFAAYENAFGKGKFDTTVSLIEIDPHSCDIKNMAGTKAKHERAVKTFEAWTRDRTASNVVFEKENEVAVKSYAFLAQLFGLDWRTVKAILTTIAKVKRSFHVMREKLTNQLTLIRTILTDDIYTKKLGKFKKKLKQQQERLSHRFKPIPTG